VKVDGESLQIPSVRQTSGKKPKDLAITKEGSGLLRWALVESAWRLVKTSPKWSTFFSRLTARRQQAGHRGSGQEAVVRDLPDAQDVDSLQGNAHADHDTHDKAIEIGENVHHVADYDDNSGSLPDPGEDFEPRIASYTTGREGGSSPSASGSEDVLRVAQPTRLRTGLRWARSTEADGEGDVREARDTKSAPPHLTSALS
jgi:hypothetical protein